MNGLLPFCRIRLRTFSGPLRFSPAPRLLPSRRLCAPLGSLKDVYLIKRHPGATRCSPLKIINPRYTAKSIEHPIDYTLRRSAGCCFRTLLSQSGITSCCFLLALSARAAHDYKWAVAWNSGTTYIFFALRDEKQFAKIFTAKARDRFCSRLLFSFFRLDTIVIYTYICKIFLKEQKLRNLFPCKVSWKTRKTGKLREGAARRLRNSADFSTKLYLQSPRIKRVGMCSNKARKKSPFFT